MSLSKDLISQFVKATKDTTTVKKESTVYGTVVKYNEKTYVKIDGSDLLTPAETLSSVEEGERVSIMIKDHTATITGNYTAPSASSIKVDGMDADLKANTADIKNLVAKNAEIENLVASKATIEDLRAANAEIDTLKSNYAEIETLVADKASIGDLEAVNADIKSLKADKADIAHLEANYATIGSLNAVYADVTRLEADKANITDLTATNAKIADLEANKADITVLEANYATIEQLDAANANITNLQAETANINTALIDKANVSDLAAANAVIADLKAGKAEIADLEAANAKIADLEADKADISVLESNYATIKQLDATNANVTNLQTETANINKALIDKANVSDLNATNANVTNLQATKADVTDLNAANANINTLTGNLADITTLVNGNLTSDNIQSMVITGDKFTVEDGFIKNAMIESVNASKINTGVINTNNVSIQSNDGSMILQGNLQQFKDENGNVRIQIGKDTAGNFTFVLYDENGTGQLINQNGIQSSDAIADGLIVDAKVADNANIAGSKLDIDSVVTEVNNGSTNIKGTKIYLDDQKQTLNVAFNNMSTTVSGNTSTLESHTTSINTMNGEISQLISDTTITKQDGTTVSLKDAYNSTVDTVNSHTQTIGSLETNLNKVSTGQNKWLLEMFEKGDGIDGQSPITIKDIIGKPLRRAILVDDSVTSNQSQFDNQYLGRATTYVYLDEDYSWETTATSDDGSTIYLNGAAIATLTSCAPTAVTVPFKQGWNKITWVYNEGIGGDGWDFNPRLTTLSQVKYMNAYPMTNVDEVGNTLDGDIKTVSSKQTALEQNLDGFKQTVSETYATNTSLTNVSNNLQNNYSTTSAMNSAIEQKANEITSSVSETYATKSSVTDLSNNLTNNYSTTSAMNSAINQKANEITSTVSETYATKAEFDNLSIGGRNLAKNSNFAKGSLHWGTIHSASDTILHNGHKSLRISMSGADNYTWSGASQTVLNDIQPNTTITMSCWYYVEDKSTFDNSFGFELKGDRDGGEHQVLMGIGVTPNEMENGVWKKLVATATTNCHWNSLYIFPWVAKNGTVYVTDIKVELGNKATDWSPAPEDIDDSIAVVDNKFVNYSTTNQMNSAINQKANEITSTVSETYATKASLTTVDNKFANYSTTSAMNSAINQKSDAILSTVSSTYATKTALKTTDDKFANYSTTSQMNSAINQKSDSILSTVSKTYTTKADFNNLTLGGTNLIANSAPKSTSGYSTYAGASGSWSLSLVDCSMSTYGKAIRATSNNASAGGMHKQPIDYTKLVKNEYYTLSAWIRASKNCTANFKNEYMSKDNYINITTEWKYYSYTDKLTGSGNHSDIIYLSSGIQNGMWIEVHSLKLEKGTKPSSWTPAPEDIDSAISTVDGKFANYSTTSQMNSAINQKGDSILSTVSSTYTTKADFNNLTVGGTNLLLNSKDYNNAAWNNDKATITSDIYMGTKVYKTQGTAWNTIAYKMNDLFSRKMIELNTDYTFSAYVKSSASTYTPNINFYGHADFHTHSNTKVGTANTSWQKVSITFKFKSINSCAADKDHSIRFEPTTASSNGEYIMVCGLKLEKGNRATGWSPAPEDADKAISTVDGKFASYSTTSQMNSAINQKANEITSSVSNTYATKSALNTVDGKFANYSTTSQMNSAINQKGDSILSTVSNTYATKSALNTVDGKFANYSTTSAMNSAINQKGDSILSTVSSTYTTKSDFNNLSIGGRNYIRNAGFKDAKPGSISTLSNWTAWGDINIYSGQGNSNYNRPNTIYLQNRGTRGAGIWQDISSTLIPPNTECTISYFCNKEGNVTSCDVFIEYYDSNNNRITTKYFGIGAYTTKVTTFTTHSSYSKLRVVISHNGTKDSTGGYLVVIGNIKLEKGKKATDFSFAPEDVDNAISTVDGKFASYSTTSQMNSAINQKANEITSTVSNTYATKAALNTVDGKFANYSTTSQMNSAINQKANEINLNVSNTYATKTSVTDLSNNLTNNYSTTQQMNSAIDIAKSGIKLDVSQNYASKHEVAHYFEGENKWKLDVYSLGSMSISAHPTKELMVQNNCQYLYSILIEHPNYQGSYSDTYVGYVTTYMYFTAAHEWHGRVVTDDAGSVYLNDEFVISTESCQWTDITLNFRVGWNKVEVLYAEGGGGDGWQFDPAILPNPNGVMTKMNCYGQNSTEEYIKANYSTTEQMNSAINIAKDNINLAVSQTYTTKSETNDKINNIKVGGTNFVRNGRFKGCTPGAVNAVPEWYASGIKVWYLLGQSGYDKYGCLYFHKEIQDGNICYLYQDILLEPIGRGVEVTLSYDISTEGNNTTEIYVEYVNYEYTRSFEPIFFETNGNGHAEHTFTTTTNTDAKYIRVVYKYTSIDGMTGGYLAIIGNVKLEKGNKATDWSPNPNDIDASIQAVDGKFVNYSTTQQMNSAIDQKANEITNSVSQSYSTKTETNNAVNNLQGQINDTNNNISNNYASKSELQQTTNSITAKFSGSGGYNLLRNTGFKNGLNYWGIATYNNPQNGVVDIWGSGHTWGFPDPDANCCVILISNQSDIEYGISQNFTTTIGKTYTVSFYYASHRMSQANMIIRKPDGNWLTNKSFNPSEKSGGNADVNNWGILTHTFTATHTNHTINIVVNSTQDNGHMWIAKPMICEGELLCPYSPHPSEVYDGITRIDKDGIKVYHNNIDGSNYTHMAPTGFYINNRGEDVFRVDTNGLYLKGNVTITNGSVPSSLLNGQISDGLIGEWIKNGATNGSNAKSTLDNNAGNWNATTERVNGSSAAWDNAYNRVVDWAYGSVGGRTTINGGLLQTNTVTTQHLAIGDFNNYSQLVPGHNLSNRYGYVNWSGGGDHFYWGCPGDSQYLPFTINETVNPFKQGDKVAFKFEAYAQVDLDVSIGVWFYSDDYASAYMTERTVGIHIYPGWNGYSAQVTIDCNETKWARSVAIMINKGADKYLEVRNVVIARMTGNVMIEDGAITASKISAGAVTADKINVTDLSALNASIGGFSMYSGKLVGNGGNGVGMSGNGDDWAFWAGSNTGGNAPFHVGHEGNLYATQAYITGTITSSTINGGTINGGVINGSVVNSDSFIGDLLAIDGTISAKSLQVEDIDNAKYPGAVTADFKLYVSTSGNDDSEIENGATFATFDGLLDKLPKNLNGHEVRIEMSTDITENVDFKGFFGGKIRLYMKGHTLYGYLVSRMGSARINVNSGYIGNASDTSNGWGKIHPSKGYAVSSYTTTVASVDQGAIGLYNIDVYGADNYLSGSTTKLGVAGQDWGTAYLNGVSYYGCDIGARANAGGRIHDVLSYNVCTKYGFYATTGGYITLAKSEHSGGKSKNYHEADAGKVIVASGATFASGEASVPGGAAPVVPTTKTITIKSTYGDTYRSSVYNSWKKDGTARQGDYGYGDCNGCWFFGDAFSDLEGKTINKVTIKITRQSGGSSSAVGLVVKSHGHSGRPSGAPSYRTTAGTLSLATGASGTLTITNSTILSEISSGAVKGFGIQSTYNSSNYAVCSGSVTVKITYTE